MYSYIHRQSKCCHSGIIHFAVVQGKGQSYLRYICLRGLLWLCGYKRMWTQSDISIYHPVFQKSRAWTNRGVCLRAGKSSHWPSVSVGSCKQPCGVLPQPSTGVYTATGRRHFDSEWWKARGGLWKLPCFASKREKLWLACLTQLAVSIISVVKEAGELIPCLAKNSAFWKWNKMKKLSLTGRNNTATNREQLLFHLSLLPQTLNERRELLSHQFQSCWRHLQSTCL